MTYINYGDPEPGRGKILEDKHGDYWQFLNGKWETPETRPFVWADMHKAWFPMKEAR